MCKEWPDSKPCLNYRCPHNLFWERLGLNRRKINLTNKALEIRNCCCLIKNPWTSEEIAKTWGLPKERIREFEAGAWRKVLKQNFHRHLSKGIYS